VVESLVEPLSSKLSGSLKVTLGLAMAGLSKMVPDKLGGKILEMAGFKTADAGFKDLKGPSDTEKLVKATKSLSSATEELNTLKQKAFEQNITNPADIDRMEGMTEAIEKQKAALAARNET